MTEKQQLEQLEQRIHALETAYMDSLGISPKHRDQWRLATTLQRALLPSGKLRCGWGLGLGMLNRPKLYFTGRTISEAFTAASDHFAF